MARHPTPETRHLSAERIEIASPAKVNLTLEVGARRADGYHEIDSVVQVIELADRLAVERAPAGVIEVAVDVGDAPQGPAVQIVFQPLALYWASGELSART